MKLYLGLIFFVSFYNVWGQQCDSSKYLVDYKEEVYYVTLLKDELIPTNKKYNEILSLINTLECDTLPFFKIAFIVNTNNEVDSLTLDSLIANNVIFDIGMSSSTIGYYLREKKMYLFFGGKGKIRLKRYISCPR